MYRKLVNKSKPTNAENIISIKVANPPILDEIFTVVRVSNSMYKKDKPTTTP